MVFLGDAAERRLFDDEDAVGKTIYIQSVPFTVIGVMQHKAQMGSYQGRDEDVIVMPANTFVAIFGDPWLDNIIYQPVIPDNSAEVEKKVLAAMGAKHRFDPEDESALNFWDTIEQQKITLNVLLGIEIFLGIIGGLTLIIAGVGVANIMYVSIRERTREIGVKMAMGARKSYIVTQFLLEAVGITFLGGFFGMSFTYITTEIFRRIPTQSEIFDIMGKPIVSFEIGMVVIIILGIMGLLSGLFPALRAASINPVDALRYE